MLAINDSNEAQNVRKPSLKYGRGSSYSSRRVLDNWAPQFAKVDSE